MAMNELRWLRLSLLVCVLAAGTTQATVTNVRLYSLGEADAGAVPLNPGNATTVDSAAGVNASKIGLTTYNGTGGGGPPVGVGLAPGSSLSMRFINIDSRYVAGPVAGLTANFGMEAYILPTAVADARPFYNGGDGTPLGTLANGCGLGILAGQYQALVGAVAIPTGVAAIPGKAVEMALVLDAGVFNVYVQDILKASLVVPPYVPAAASDVLSLGNFIGNQSPPAYAGVVDEARVFTFTAGNFNATTDLGPAAIPEPATLAFVTLGGLAALRKRRARA
jgi:hypothetical protein